MRLRDEVIGALNLFSIRQMRLDPQEVRVVQSLADVATIAILQERSIARAEALTEQLQGALNSRIVIEQAKGALARMEGISVDEAFEVMRRRARSQRAAAGRRGHGGPGERVRPRRGPTVSRSRPPSTR